MPYLSHRANRSRVRIGLVSVKATLPRSFPFRHNHSVERNSIPGSDMTSICQVCRFWGVGSGASQALKAGQTPKKCPPHLGPQPLPMSRAPIQGSVQVLSRDSSNSPEVLPPEGNLISREQPVTTPGPPTGSQVACPAWSLCPEGRWPSLLSPC